MDDTIGILGLAAGLAKMSQDFLRNYVFHPAVINFGKG